jgi:hypothetical protein
MTPDVEVAAQPVTIINPHVQTPPKELAKPKPEQDRTAAASAPIEPLVIVNPFVAPSRAVAQTN